ncbi:hypothetical protein AADZ90_015885 [Aestuariibius sp. 2305UL40-4]|uniref:hypothetical protein n=1 Tax=Aestuariibius violaceus TaxID=3234132 RepID=UPI00345F10A1
MSNASILAGETRAIRRSRAAAIAWCSILAGALSGGLMGLWSFDGPVPTPDWIGDYDSLSRRFLRLAHVAMFALGILHMLVARQITEAPLRPDIDRLGLQAMAAGNVLMPTTLIAAAVWEPLKFLTPIPMLALTTALAIAAISAVRNYQGELR